MRDDRTCRRLFGKTLTSLAITPFIVGVMQPIWTARTAAQTTDYTCTRIIGYSETQNWFDVFMTNVKDPAQWELVWVSGGAARYWADPNYVGWTTAPTSPCSQNADAPDRVVMDITRDEYQTDPAVFQTDIQNVIATIRQKLPSAQTIVLEPAVGGPASGWCPQSATGSQNDTVRASFNHSGINEAIDRVLNGATGVARGPDPALSDCSGYGDLTGHLTTGGAAAVGATLATWFNQRDGTAIGAGGGGPATFTFVDIPANHVLIGQYPAQVADWGSGDWWVSGPWGGFTTNSVSFAASGATSATIVFTNPYILTQLDAYNGASSASTVTVSCPSNAVDSTVSVTLPAGALVPSIRTNWTQPCGTAVIGSSNGWWVNFDNLVLH